MTSSKNLKFSKIIDSLYIKGRIGWKGLKKDEYLQQSGYRIINGKSVKDGRIDWNETGYITQTRYDESPEIMLQDNDIVITKDGTIGKVAMIDDLTLPTTVASGLFVLRNINPKKWDTKFLYYYLTSPFFKTFVISRIEGSVIPHLYQRDFEQLELPEFSLEEQHEMANILTALDKKIAENKKINHHLAEIAQAIFNSWFVDYEPFGGNIPSEWNEINFDEISTVQNGYAFKSKDYVTEGIRMIRTTNFDNGYINNNGLIMLSSEFYENTKYRNFVFKKFDTVIVMVGASVGKISLVTELNVPSLQNQNMWRFRSTNPEVPASFIHFNVKSINDKVRGWASGSARDFYRKDIFKKAKIFLPTQQVLSAFSEITLPIFEQISNNILENDKLIITRDSLLLKLMSGEISVAD